MHEQTHITVTKNSNKDMSLVAWYDFVMEIEISIYVHFSLIFLLNGSLIALFWAV
jgi:hypothetical protein